jgi:hypothetical protein
LYNTLPWGWGDLCTINKQTSNNDTHTFITKFTVYCPVFVFFYVRFPEKKKKFENLTWIQRKKEKFREKNKDSEKKTKIPRKKEKFGEFKLDSQKKGKILGI